MNQAGLYRRLLRRELHRSRSVAVAVVMVVLALAALYAALECVLAALGYGPLLVSPSAASEWLASAPPLALAIAGAAVVLGIILIVIAFAPARRGRHSVPHDRLAVVVDDSVIAGAVARAARRATGVAPGRVNADVSARITRVTVTPTSGVPIDRAATQAALDDTLATLSPSPRLRARLGISEGTVGS